MKALEKTSNYKSGSHSDSPFIHKKGGGDFFQKKNESERPFFSPSVIQTKLSVGEPGDKYELEADKMSEQVVNKISNNDKSNSVQRELVCEDEAGEVQQSSSEDQLSPKSMFNSELPVATNSNVQKKSSANSSEVDDGFERTLSQEKGKGSAMDSATQSTMEGAFGRDFSNVRVHTNNTAVQLSRDINAHAFTSGNDIFFNKDRFQPGSTDGKKLLSHELTHVVQQGKAEKPAAPKNSIQRFKENNPQSGIQRKQDSLMGIKVGSDKSNVIRRCAPGCSSPQLTFNPPIGTKNTLLKGTYGDFNVKHGLTKKPTKSAFGEYTLKIEMTPNAKAGTSEIGFVQTSRQGKQAGGWATKATDRYMSQNKAERTEAAGGWRVDRADYKGDKTPFYGMYKDAASGDIKQYSTSSVGKFGGGKAMLSDVPGVGLFDHMEFTATAKDMTGGKEFGAVAWGYKYNEDTNLYSEETPFLASAGSTRIKGRDRAITKWNTDIAKPGSGVDKVP